MKEITSRRWFYILLIPAVALWFIALNYFLAEDMQVAAGITVLAVPAVAFLLSLYFDPDFFIYSMAFFVPLSVKMDLPNGFSVSVPSEILMILMAGYLFLHPRTIRSLDRKIFTHPVFILLALEIAWLLVCSLFSTFHLVSFKRTIITTLYILAFFLAFLTRFDDPKKILKFYLFYGLGLIIPVIHGMIWHAHYNFSQPSSYIMPQPFFAEHAIYGASLAFVIPPLLYMAFARGDRSGIRGSKRLVIPLILLIILGEFLSFSRGAWLSLILMGIVFLVLLFRIRIPLILLVSICALLLVSMNTDRISQLISRTEARSNRGNIREQIASVSNIQTDISNLERVNRWKCALRMFRDKPVTGFGPGTYQFNYYAYQQRNEMTRISTVYGNRGNSHSEYLGALAECGLPGFIIFIFLLFFTILTAVKIIYLSPDKVTRNVTLAVILGLTTFYIHSFFNSFADNDEIASLYYGSLAAIVALDVNIFRRSAP